MAKLPETVEVTADVELCGIDVINVINIKPTDLIVITYGDHMSSETYRRLVDALSDGLGGAKVVVLEDGMEIKAILRQEGGEND